MNLDQLQKIASEADEGYAGAHQRDSNNWQANEAFCRACDPPTVLHLIAIARAADAQLSAYDAITQGRDWPGGDRIKAHEESEQALREALAPLLRFSGEAEKVK